jgi:hypothetical protein
MVDEVGKPDRTCTHMPPVARYGSATVVTLRTPFRLHALAEPLRSRAENSAHFVDRAASMTSTAS